MNVNELSFEKKAIGIVGLTILIVVILLIAFYLIGGTTTGFSLQQFIGVIVAAVFSGIVTLLLLLGQTETIQQQRKGEAERDKDVRVYTNKIAAFSSFNKAVWDNNLDDTDVERYIETIKIVRKVLFSRVILYLNTSEIDEIKTIVENNSKGEQGKMPVVLSSIVEVLKKNSQLKEDKESQTDGKAGYSTSCQDLWDAFGNWINLYDRDSEESDELQTVCSEQNSQDYPRREEGDKLVHTFSIQPWHFSMWGYTQLDYLEGGGKEVSLVEYGPIWRTSLVKMVSKGDIVFLFRGNRRYSGVYKALGWRVLKYFVDDSGQRVVSEEVSDGISRSVVPSDRAVPIDSVKEKLGQHDIYRSFEDPSSTSCANIVVECLSYIRDGVYTDNGVYRKTISRYNRTYAARLLEAFLAKDASCRNTIEKSIPGFLQANHF